MELKVNVCHASGGCWANFIFLDSSNSSGNGTSILGSYALKWLKSTSFVLDDDDEQHLSTANVLADSSIGL